MSFYKASPLTPHPLNLCLSSFQYASSDKLKQFNSSIETSAEETQEVSTPLLPKRRSMWEAKLSFKKSRFSLKQSFEKPENTQCKITAQCELEVTPFAEPVSALSQHSEAGSSCYGEDSPVKIRKNFNNRGKKVIDNDIYRRAEEYLDSENLVIIPPEDHRRRPFINLRVSTAKAMLLQSNEPASAGVVHESDSPSLISPSIFTSTLLQRRSSSKDLDNGSRSGQMVLGKSPFYIYQREGNRISNVDFGFDGESVKAENNEDDEDEIFECLNLEKMQIGAESPANRLFDGSFEEKRNKLETLSNKSFEIGENSPLKVEA